MEKPNLIQLGKQESGITIYGAWNPLINQLQPLDFFLTRSNTSLGLGIRIVQKNYSPDRESEYNHAGIFPDGYGCTLECLYTLTSNNFFDLYENKKVLIARYTKITPQLALYSLKNTNKHIGQIYPVHRIFFHLFNLAYIVHWQRLVCSEYVAKNLYYIGARGYHYFGATPDMLADEVKNELNKNRTGPKYQIIYEDTLPINIYRFCPACNSYYLLPWIKNDIVNLPECPKNKNHPLKYLSNLDSDLDIKINDYNSKKLEWYSST